MSNKLKHILVVGGIREVHDCLLKYGCKITWFIKNSNIMPNDQDRNCIRTFMYDENNESFLCDVAKTIDSHDKIDLVCSFHDEMQLLALAISQALGLEFMYNKDTIKNTRDKYLMRNALKKDNLCSIQSLIVESESELKSFVDINLRTNDFIVKPIAGTGSFGVFKVTRDSLKNKDLEAVEYPVLIEEYVTGKEYSVESFSLDGEHHIVGITEKFTIDGTYMESGHLVPGRCTKDQRRRIENYVSQCLSTLNINNGPCHSEIIINESEIFFIETHTRTGGDQIPRLVNISYNIDLYNLTAMNVLGLSIDNKLLEAKKETTYSCIKFKVQQPSILPIKEISGLEKAQSFFEVEDIYVRYQVGQILPPVNHSFDRSASVLVKSNSLDSVLEVADEALTSINFIF